METEKPIFALHRALQELPCSFWGRADRGLCGASGCRGFALTLPEVQYLDLYVPPQKKIDIYIYIQIYIYIYVYIFVPEINSGIRAR